MDDHGDKIADGMDKAGKAVNDRTGGKHAAKIDQAKAKARDALDHLDDKKNVWEEISDGMDQIQIGKNQAGAWISSMDVVVHEFGHGVDDKTPGGISGGGTFAGALKVCAEAPAGSTVLCMLADTGERYLSVPDFLPE